MLCPFPCVINFNDVRILIQENLNCDNSKAWIYIGMDPLETTKTTTEFTYEDDTENDGSDSHIILILVAIHASYKLYVKM